MSQKSSEPMNKAEGKYSNYKERLKKEVLKLAKDEGTTINVKWLDRKARLERAKEILQLKKEEKLHKLTSTARPQQSDLNPGQMKIPGQGTKQLKKLQNVEQKKMALEMRRAQHTGTAPVVTKSSTGSTFTPTKSDLTASATFDTDFAEERQPWYLYPFGVCWTCKVQITGNAHLRCGKRTPVEDLVKWVYMVNSLLWNICYRLRIPTLDHLLLFTQTQLATIASRGKRLKIPAALRNAMKFFEKVNGIESLLGKQYCSMPPNCVAALIHQRIINFFLYDTQLKFEAPKRIFSGHLRGYNGNFVSDSMDMYIPGVNITWPMAGDAHIHLDMLLKQSGKHDYDSVIVRLPDAQAVFMDLIVTSYSNPILWPRPSTRDNLKQDCRFKMAIGWNPKFSFTWNEGLEKTFSDWLYRHDVVAAGEIGLDYFADISPQERDGQLQHLCRLLPYVRESGLPLIIYCRQNEIGRTLEHSVVDDCVDIMRKFLPPLYSVYVSAFNGGVQDFEKWCCNFPNVRFGISPVIVNVQRKHQYLDKAVEMMEECRIMLETNVPYHTPDAYMQDKLVAQPDLLVAVADKVASIRLSHRALVMDVALQNTRTFYRC